MLTSPISRLAALTVVGALVAAPAAWAAPHALTGTTSEQARVAASATERQAPTTITFDTSTASGDRSTRTTTGTFTMTGPFEDAGIVRTSYRFAGTRVDATATLVGARGMFALSLRGTSGPTVSYRQSAAGRWRVCGGTGAYRRLHGHGRWQADADFGAAGPDLLAPTIRGTFGGRLYRAPGHAGGRAPRSVRC